MVVDDGSNGDEYYSDILMIFNRYLILFSGF